jgi:hypothetical protein
MSVSKIKLRPVSVVFMAESAPKVVPPWNEEYWPLTATANLYFVNVLSSENLVSGDIPTDSSTFEWEWISLLELAEWGSGVEHTRCSEGSE